MALPLYSKLRDIAVLRRNNIQSQELPAIDADNLVRIQADRPYPCPRCKEKGYFTSVAPDPVEELGDGDECPLCEAYGYTYVEYESVIGFRLVPQP